VVIVDTTVWVDYLQGTKNPETDWVHAELDRQRLGLTDVILCEVLQGIRDEFAAKDIERQLLKLELFETGGGLGEGRGPKLSDASWARTHGSQDHRLSDRHLLHTRATLAAAPGSRF